MPLQLILRLIVAVLVTWIVFTIYLTFFYPLLPYSPALPWAIVAAVIGGLCIWLPFSIIFWEDYSIWKNMEDKNSVQNQQSKGLTKKAKSNQHLKEVSTERVIKKTSIKPVETLSQKHLKTTEKAALVLKYNDKAKQNWGKLKTIPERYKNHFLDSLEEDPKQDTAALASKIIKMALSPYDDEEANQALQTAFKLSEEAGNEFNKVYKTLGTTVPVEKIIAKIEKEYGVSALLKIQQLRSRRLRRNDPALHTTKFFVSKSVEEVAMLQALGYKIIQDKPVFENCTIQSPIGSRVVKIQTNKQFTKYIENEIGKKMGLK